MLILQEESGSKSNENKTKNPQNFYNNRDPALHK